MSNDVNVGRSHVIQVSWKSSITISAVYDCFHKKLNALNKSLHPIKFSTTDHYSQKAKKLDVKHKLIYNVLLEPFIELRWR